jgi:predicted nucleic acid-binding protein
VTRRIAIVDTGVVLAALYSSTPQSPVAAILQGMIQARFPFAISSALLAEYRTVLVRPQARERHGLAIFEVEQILLGIAQHAIVLEPAEGPLAPHPCDQFLYDLLAAREDLVLVTGDRRLLADKAIAPRAMNAREFLESLEPEMPATRRPRPVQKAGATHEIRQT